MTTKEQDRLMAVVDKFEGMAGIAQEQTENENLDERGRDRMEACAVYHRNSARILLQALYDLGCTRKAEVPA